MATTTITITGVPRIVARLSPELYRPALTGMIADLAVIAQTAARAAAPKDTNAGVRSIMADVQATQAVIGRGMLTYMRVMDQGRRPGAAMPPPQALAGWARRHGYSGSLFVLARSIARRGIRGRFFMQRGYQATVRALPAATAKFARDVQAAWGR